MVYVPYVEVTGYTDRAVWGQTWVQEPNGICRPLRLRKPVLQPSQPVCCSLKNGFVFQTCYFPAWLMLTSCITKQKQTQKATTVYVIQAWQCISSLVLINLINTEWSHFLLLCVIDGFYFWQYVIIKSIWWTFSQEFQLVTWHLCCLVWLMLFWLFWWRRVLNLRFVAFVVWVITAFCIFF